MELNTDKKVDKEYWASPFVPPLAPSESDVLIYKGDLLPGETLLLGCTRQLLELSHEQMDIDPWYSGPNVIKQEWTTNTKQYTNIIGDGVLNLTKALSDGVLRMCSKTCRVFVARSFNRRLETMRIAAHFPKAEDFSINPAQVRFFDDYTFFTWRF
jgi:hypothetical protein